MPGIWEIWPHTPSCPVDARYGEAISIHTESELSGNNRCCLGRCKEAALGVLTTLPSLQVLTPEIK